MSDLIPLSAIDHVLTRPVLAPLQLVFEFPTQLDSKLLVESFHATARRFVGIGATLTRLDEHTIAFDVARDVSEIRVTTDGPNIPLHACLDPVRTELGQPLARARIVDRGSRGTAVGFSMSHAVADGYGFFLFLAAWAAQARGADFPAPNCDRRLLTSAAARESPPSIAAVGPLEQSGFFLVDEGQQPLSFSLEERFISQLELRAQKQREPGNYSSSDLLAAHLWKEYLQHEHFPSTTLACPVDLRRHRTALGPLYFGNAFLNATVTVSTEQLRAASAPEIAGWIHAAVDAVPQRVDAGIAELEALWSTRGLAALQCISGCPPDTGFLISNMSRISLAAFDFGTGPAVSFDCALATTRAPQRVCFVLPAGDDLRLLGPARSLAVSRLAGEDAGLAPPL
jgi:Transferase family